MHHSLHICSITVAFNHCFRGGIWYNCYTEVIQKETPKNWRTQKSYYCIGKSLLKRLFQAKPCFQYMYNCAGWGTHCTCNKYISFYSWDPKLYPSFEEKIVYKMMKYCGYHIRISHLLLVGRRHGSSRTTNNQMTPQRSPIVKGGPKTITYKNINLSVTDMRKWPNNL